MTIENICTQISSGGTPLKSHAEYYGGNIPWLRTNEITFNTIESTECYITENGLVNSSARWIPANCVIVAISGATAARCAINSIPLTTNQHCCNLEINPAIADYRYVFHWLSAHYTDLKSKGRGGRKDLTNNIISNYPICIPSLQKQNEIVQTLNKFDYLHSNLSIEIPIEIDARRKQYECYRDRLLSFEKIPSKCNTPRDTWSYA